MRYLPALILLASTASSQTWLQIADFPSGKRDDGIAAVVGNTAFIGSGLQEGWTPSIDFKALDLTTHSWSSIPDMPHTTERQYACAFAGPGCFYVFGGDGVGGALNNLWKYTLASATWSQVSSKPGSGLIGAVCLPFGDKVIIAGGKTGASGPVSSEVWEYTLSNDTWQQKNNFPFTACWRACATVLNNTGYFLFGIDGSGFFHKELYMYSPQNDTWSKVTDFPGNKGRAYAALQAATNKLLVFGGYDSSNVYYNDVWFYHPVAGTWSQDVSLPSGGRKGGMSLMANGRFYYSCGITQSNQRLNETWMLDVPLGVENQISAEEYCFTQSSQPDHVLLCIPQKFASRSLKVLICDYLGRNVSVNSTRLENELRIDLENTDPGIYFVRLIVDGEIVFYRKIIKQ